jgi:hypothetical protein
MRDGSPGLGLHVCRIQHAQRRPEGASPSGLPQRSEIQSPEIQSPESWEHRNHDAKSDAAVRTPRDAAVAVGTAGKPRVVDERTAPQDASRVARQLQIFPLSTTRAISVLSP